MSDPLREETLHALDAYDFHLPPALIAQQPPLKRDGGQLLAVGDAHHVGDAIYPFTALPTLLTAGDLLVFNTSKVVPARLFGQKQSGGKIEILLERILGTSDCFVQIRASKTPAIGTLLHTAGGDFIVEQRQDTFYQLRAIGKNGRAVSVRRRFLQHGEIPLPPYIRRAATTADSRRYQTVYARESGSVAAPTAGLHFSKPLLRALAARGIASCQLHLHVAAGTFMPLRSSTQTTLHSEQYAISAATAEQIRRTKQQGGRVIAVGTTSLRALEAAANRAACAAHSNGQQLLASGSAETDLFIRPGYPFRVADMLITNFHLPRSTLFMLVCAFGGSQRLQAAYQHAIAKQMRFYSYGDAMLLTAAPAP